MVAKITEADIHGIVLTEGQKWELFDQDTFFVKEDVIPALKTRFNDYLAT
jgi:hypothetical protein